MRHPSKLPGIMGAGIAAAVAVAGVLAVPALASSPAAAPVHTAARTAAGSLSPTGVTSTGSDQGADQAKPLPLAEVRPHPATVQLQHPTIATKVKAAVKAAATSCTPADFDSRSGSALVSFVEGSTTDCVNTLFDLTGTDAAQTFGEAKMISVANAFTSVSATYPGDDSTSDEQLVLFLRAGYYVQYNDAADVGNYDSTLTTAVQKGLDSFLNGPHALTVSDANGDVLAEVITLTDSADLQARYIYAYKELLNGYNSSYDAYSNMLVAVNNVYTPLFRGHENPAFISAVTADPSIIDTLSSFALNHLSLLGTDNAYLDSNAGIEATRFLDTPALQAKVRPIALGLLNASSITGTTAPLWVGVAGLADEYDQAQCSYYNVCDLVSRLTAAALPTTHICDSTRTILAQALTAADLAGVCASLENQDPYYTGLVKATGPIPNQYMNTQEMVIFGTETDYQTYAPAIYGVDTDNGGITLTGDPTDPTNKPISLMFQRPDDGFVADVWNLNHEYTHYLQSVYDMKGDFDAQIAVPDVWWIEGEAEYVSYSYRNVTDTEAMSDAALHTYNLSTLFQNTYDNSDTTRTYPWGYLAVRYMFEKHPTVIYNMLADFRVGNYTAGYAVYNSIGTSYDADFNTWLNACAAGACTAGGGTPQGGPTAAFTDTVSGLTAAFTDKSTDTAGTISSRSWNFGDGTSSTATNPSKTYAKSGTYTVTLTVGDNNGQSATTYQTVTVSGGLPQCPGTDTRVMGQNCSRTGLSATAGNLDYMYVYLPAGTTTLTITTSGGTGNANLYYDPTTWATSTTYTARSTNSGNTESITVTNSSAGYRYISLYAATAFSGVTVSTQY